MCRSLGRARRRGAGVRHRARAQCGRDPAPGTRRMDRDRALGSLGARGEHAHAAAHGHAPVHAERFARAAAEHALRPGAGGGGAARTVGCFGCRPHGSSRGRQHSAPLAHRLRAVCVRAPGAGARAHRAVARGVHARARPADEAARHLHARRPAEHGERALGRAHRGGHRGAAFQLQRRAAGACVRPVRRCDPGAGARPYRGPHRPERAAAPALARAEPGAAHRRLQRGGAGHRGAVGCGASLHRRATPVARQGAGQIARPAPGQTVRPLAAACRRGGRGSTLSRTCRLRPDRNHGSVVGPSAHARPCRPRWRCGRRSRGRSAGAAARSG